MKMASIARRTQAAAGTLLIAVLILASLFPQLAAAQSSQPEPASTAPATAPALTVQVAGATSVTATWTAVDGAARYVLMRHEGEWTQIGGNELTATTFTDTGLTTGQKYYYAVIAGNAAGYGPWSELVSVTVTPPDGTDTRPADPDRDVLVALYNATAGPGWANNTNWLSDKPLAEWHGVTTDGNGRVTALNLSGNRLSGTIPPSLGNLSNLTRLHLGWGPETQTGNKLSGSIPAELGNLSNLTELILHANQLSGSIPTELGNLSKLTVLALQTNQLSGSIPTELGNLSKLQFLYLSNNQLSGSIPSELGKLTDLTVLVFWGNQLSGSIPSELGNLSNLQYLYLTENQLSGSIPTELGNLSNLLHLNVRTNPLGGEIPPALGNLTNLTELILQENQLTGEIPSELNNLTNLVKLNLRSNQLEGGIPAWLGNLSNLTHLALSGNQLSGSIPTQLGKLTNLTELHLARNPLTGCIPAGWQNVPDNDLDQLGLQFCVTAGHRAGVDRTGRRRCLGHGNVDSRAGRNRLRTVAGTRRRMDAGRRRYAHRDSLYRHRPDDRAELPLCCDCRQLSRHGPLVG